MRSKHFREKNYQHHQKIIAKNVNRGNESHLPVKFIPTAIYINELSTKGNTRKPTSNFSFTRFI